MDECRKANAICIDLMAELDFDLAADFYDSMHTTASGSRRIGIYFHDRLVAAGVGLR